MMKDEYNFSQGKRGPVEPTLARRTRLHQTRLAQECAKLDIEEEKELAEEGMDQEGADWPEY